MFALVLALALGSGVSPPPSAVDAVGVCRVDLTAPKLLLTTASGQDAITIPVGAELCLDYPNCYYSIYYDNSPFVNAITMSGPLSIWQLIVPSISLSLSPSVFISYSSDDDWIWFETNAVALGGSLTANGNVSATAFTASSNWTVVRGDKPNAATAVAVKVSNSAALTTAGAEIVAFYSDAESTKRAAIDKDGSYRQVSAPTLQTCAAAKRYTKSVQAGGSAGKYDKVCMCVSNNQASPTYAWKNISGRFADEASSVGNTTTCPDP